MKMLNTTTLFLLLLLSSVSALAQSGGGCYAGTVIAPPQPLGLGQPSPGAIVRVCSSTATGTPCSPLTPGGVFSDTALSNPISNPLTADVNGNYNFCASNGNYLVQIFPQPGTTYSFETTVGIAPSGSYTFSGNNIFTGTNQFSGIELSDTLCTGVLAGFSVLCATSSGPEVSINGGGFLFMPTIAGDIGGTSSSPTVTSAHITGGTVNTMARFNATGNLVPSACADNGSTVACTGNEMVGGALTVSGAVSVGTTLGVTGNSTLSGGTLNGTYGGNPTLSGNVTEIAGQNQHKAFSFNSVLWVDGIKYTTLAGCYADIPSGGVCMVPPGYSETLVASVTMNKNGAGFAFQGPAIITMGSNQFVISAGTHGAFITGPMDQGGQACTALPCTTYTNSTELIYTGNSSAIVIGAATPATQHPKIRGIYVNLSGAGNAAIGIDVVATAGHFDISNNFILGSGGASNTQAAIVLDGGGTSFTCDGEIDENFIINVLTGIKTANMSCENVYKGNQIACNPGSTPATIGMDFEDNTFGNTILGGNYSACSVIWKVAGTSNANYGIFPVNQETTDATFASGTSMNVALFLPQVGGGSNNPPVVTDAGTNNTYSNGVTVPTRAFVRQVSAVGAIGTTTIFTTQAVDTEYKVEIAAACDTSSASSTVSTTIKFTDPSNTVQTVASLAAIACNTLGSSSVASASFPFIAKASTAVQYSTTIANTPTYDLRIAVTQLGTN